MVKKILKAVGLVLLAAAFCYICKDALERHNA